MSQDNQNNKLKIDIRGRLEDKDPINSIQKDIQEILDFLKQEDILKKTDNEILNIFNKEYTNNLLGGMFKKVTNLFKYKLKQNNLWPTFVWSEDSERKKAILFLINDLKDLVKEEKAVYIVDKRKGKNDQEYKILFSREELDDFKKRFKRNNFQEANKNEDVSYNSDGMDNNKIRNFISKVRKDEKGKLDYNLNKEGDIKIYNNIEIPLLKEDQLDRKYIPDSIFSLRGSSIDALVFENKDIEEDNLLNFFDEFNKNEGDVIVFPSKNLSLKEKDAFLSVYKKYTASNLEKSTNNVVPLQIVTDDRDLQKEIQNINKYHSAALVYENNLVRTALSLKNRNKKSKIVLLCKDEYFKENILEPYLFEDKEVEINKSENSKESIIESEFEVEGGIIKNKDETRFDVVGGFNNKSESGLMSDVKSKSIYHKDEIKSKKNQNIFGLKDLKNKKVEHFKFNEEDLKIADEISKKENDIQTINNNNSILLDKISENKSSSENQNITIGLSAFSGLGSIVGFFIFGSPLILILSAASVIGAGVGFYLKNQAEEEINQFQSAFKTNNQTIYLFQKEKQSLVEKLNTLKMERLNEKKSNKLNQKEKEKKLSKKNVKHFKTESEKTNTNTASTVDLSDVSSSKEI